MAKKDEDEFTFQEKQDMPYAKVTAKGEKRRPYHVKKVWEFDLKEFLSKIDPADYFSTTGEAVLKMRKLEKDLFMMAGKARKIGNIIQKLKDDNVYMETCWTDNRLLLKAKNPRKNKEEKLKALHDNFAYGDKKKIEK
jgi:hypothetical protein